MPRKEIHKALCGEYRVAEMLASVSGGNGGDARETVCHIGAAGKDKYDGDRFLLSYLTVVSEIEVKRLDPRL